MADEVVAAIDVGTNSTRLLVSEGGRRDLERLLRITRLGQGVDRNGRLAPEAVERTLDALREFRAVMDERAVTEIRAVATSAGRDAADADRFLDAAAGVLGVRPELLSGADEGQLAFRGAVSSLDPTDGPFLVVDIGGGSTEFGVGTERCEGVLSVDMGSVRLSEAYLRHDPPQPEELTAALSVVEAHLDDVVRELPAVKGMRRMLGLAGTVTTVAAVEIGLEPYDRDRIHHFVLTRAAAEDVFRTLATETLADRVHNPGLQPERADVIVGGCCVLVQLYRYFGVDELLVSEADMLDGLVASLFD
jgi:exopolyphosphatase/guanosine-5'-triphosphate,3'-diphosphate pyrophosphatase